MDWKMDFGGYFSIICFRDNEKERSPLSSTQLTNVVIGLR